MLTSSVCVLLDYKYYIDQPEHNTKKNHDRKIHIFKYDSIIN